MPPASDAPRPGSMTVPPLFGWEVILTVLVTLLSVLQAPEAVRQILFGGIILAVAAAYTRLTEAT